jgi:hypothetical protein
MAHSHDDTFQVPELASIGLSVGPRSLNRGLLIVGASGSGKSASAMLPVLGAVRRQWRATDVASRPAALIVDPKLELVAADDPDVIHLGRHGSAAVRFYDNTVDSTDPGVVLDEALALSPAATPLSRDPFWRASARALLRACVQIDTTIFAEASDAISARLQQGEIWQLIASFFAKRGPGRGRGTEALTDMRRPWSRYLALCRELQRTPADSGADTRANDLEKVFRAHLPAYDAAELLAVCSLAADTATSVVATVASLLGPLADHRVQSAIDFDFCPWGQRSDALTMPDTIAAGALLAYQPKDISDESSMIGRAIKRAYLRAITRGAACDDTGKPVRHAYYVCDEFQRFIGGEEVFFDTMRAGGGCACVATQSLAALRHALGEGETKESALQAITSNLSSVIQFMSPDPLVTRTWQTLLPTPANPSLPHVLTIRPISMLPVGGAYWFSEGRFGYGQIRLQRDSETA